MLLMCIEPLPSCSSPPEFESSKRYSKQNMASSSNQGNAAPAPKAPKVHFLDPKEQKGARPSNQNAQSQGSSQSQKQASQPINKSSLNKPLPPPPKMEQQSLTALVDPRNTQSSMQQGGTVEENGKGQTSQR